MYLWFCFPTPQASPIELEAIVVYRRARIRDELGKCVLGDLRGRLGAFG